MIGILYESSEWSDFKLAAELAARGCDVRMIDLALGAGARSAEAHGDGRGDERAPVDVLGDALLDVALSCDVLVSRIFASAVFRGHEAAHDRMACLAPAAEARGIVLVNPARAHLFEIDKQRATEALAQAGVDVPRIQTCGRLGELLLAVEGGGLSYPCIIKPNCGGRTTLTAVARMAAEARAFLEGLAAASGVKAPAASPAEPPAASAVACAAGSTERVVPLATPAAPVGLASPFELAPLFPIAAFAEPTPLDPASMTFLVEDYLEPERGFVTRVELVDGEVALVVARSVVAGGLSAYHLGSTYELYGDCPQAVRVAALAAGRALGIGFGSFDIIENGGRAYVIDANSVSNVSPDNTETFGGFDLMAAYADAIARVARSLPAGG